MKREILCKTAVVGAMVSMASLLVAGQASATYIRGAVSVTTDVGESRPVENIINQSGLSDTYYSGITDFDDYLGDGSLVTHDYHSFDDTGAVIQTEWFADLGEWHGSLVFDLGDVLTIDRLAFWNEDSGGIWCVNVFGSQDGATWGSSLGRFGPTDNPVDINYGADIFNLTSETQSQFIKFELIASWHMENAYKPTLGIGEVAFSVAEPVPEPATMLLFGTGLVGIFGLRQRKKN